MEGRASQVTVETSMGSLNVITMLAVSPIPVAVPAGSGRVMHGLPAGDVRSVRLADRERCGVAQCQGRVAARPRERQGDAGAEGPRDRARYHRLAEYDDDVRRLRDVGLQMERVRRNDERLLAMGME